jgi:molecular chaperone GrpE (heat shock protein)
MTEDAHDAKPQQPEETAAGEAAASVIDEGEHDPTFEPEIEPQTAPGTGQGDDEGDIEAVRAEAKQYRDHLQRLQAEFEH